jgi:hypothetical protein
LVDLSFFSYWSLSLSISLTFNLKSLISCIRPCPKRNKEKHQEKGDTVTHPKRAAWKSSEATLHRVKVVSQVWCIEM